MRTLTKNNLYFLLFTVCALAIFLPIYSVEAISTSPSLSTGPPILRGTNQVRKITLLRNPDDIGDIKINVKTDRGLSEYVEIKKEITMYEGQNSLEYEIVILSKTLENDNYKGEISFLSEPKIKDSKVLNNQLGVTVIKGATLPINFSITGEEVVSYILSDTQIDDTEINKPIYFTYSINNTGTVDWKPDQIRIVFLDVKDETNVVSHTITSEHISNIQPGIDQQMHEINTSLLEGKYKSRANFYKNGKLVESLESRDFNVFAAGTFKSNGELVSVSTNKNEYNFNEKIKLSASFKNTGEVPIGGVLITEIYKSDALIDILRSEKVIVGVGSSSLFTHFFDVKTHGSYDLVSYIKYNNKQSNTIQKSLIVIKQKGFLQIVNSKIGLLIISIVILLMVFLYSWNRKRLSNKLWSDHISQDVNAVGVSNDIQNVTNEDVLNKEAVNKKDLN